MKLSFRKSVIYSLATLSLYASTANSQYYSNNSETQRLYDRINKLENDNRAMQQKLYRGKDPISSAPIVSKAPVNSVARLEAKIDKLEEQLRNLKGGIEEAQYNSNKTSAKMDMLMKDVEFRFKQADVKYGGDSATDEKKNDKFADSDSIISRDLDIVETKTSNEAFIPLDAQGQYELSFEYLKNGDYSKAESLLKEFISSNEDSSLISNAYYWLGETFYVRENYNKSAVNFLIGYQKKPKGNKAPDNLLKLGMSLQKLNKNIEACTTFEKMVKEFPSINNDLRDKVALEQSKLKC